MKRTDVIDYELPDEAHSIVHGSVGKGTIVPALIVAVDEDTDTFSGFLFLPNGQTEYVTGVPVPENKPEPAPEPAPEQPPIPPADSQPVQQEGNVQ